MHRKTQIKHADNKIEGMNMSLRFSEQPKASKYGSGVFTGCGRELIVGDVVCVIINDPYSARRIASYESKVEYHKGGFGVRSPARNDFSSLSNLNGDNVIVQYITAPQSH